MTLLETSALLARQIFSVDYAPLPMLHKNSYVIEKPDVCAIFALSMWLGKECFPSCVYGVWPPEPPADLVGEEFPGGFSSSSSGVAPAPASDVVDGAPA